MVELPYSTGKASRKVQLQIQQIKWPIFDSISSSIKLAMTGLITHIRIYIVHFKDRGAQ